MTEPGHRVGGWIQTFTGRSFWPLDARPSEVHIEDIAHSLSLLCRFAGHVRRFYSVAEHCVLMSYAVSPVNALAALLHDATEAYVVDLPAPVKKFMPEYRRAEDALWLVIAKRFGLPAAIPDEVHQADQRIVSDERAVLMAPSSRPWIKIRPLGVCVTGWPPHAAEDRYLFRFSELTGYRYLKYETEETSA